MKPTTKARVALVLALSLTACAAPARDEATPPGEKTYAMNGDLLSRDVQKNTVSIDNEDVPGVMPPMKMDYELRGATVDALPPDGTPVTMTLHEQAGTYWVTDVRAR